MIQIQTVSAEAALAHSAAIHNAAHLLSCTDYLLQALPEEVLDLPVLADLSVLLGKIDAEIIAARVKFEKVEKAAPRTVAPPQVAQQEQQAQVDAAYPGVFRIYGLAEYLEDHLAVLHKDERDARQAYEIAEAIKDALSEMIDKSGIVTTPATFSAASEIAREATREAATRWPKARAVGRPPVPCPPRPGAPQPPRPCPPAAA